MGDAKPAAPRQTPEQFAASERERLLRDKELDHLRELPWQRREAYLMLYIKQLRNEVGDNSRIEIEQRERMYRHLDNLKVLIDTAAKP